MENKITNVIPATKIGSSRGQIFSYLSKPNLELKPGQLVSIPFGRKNITGVVYETNKESGAKFKLKPISELLDATAVLSENQLKLAKWISEHYLTSLGLVVKSMLPKRSIRPPQFAYQERELEKPHLLSPDQRLALKTILTEKNRVTLLHGITGSGKTEIYLQAITEILKKGRQAIVLIPEIALTPQTTDRFINRFGEKQVAILNSKLSYGKKYREWLRIRKGEAKIVIGPRSAIFAPVKNLGLIVIDEEHENTYKQWDQHPRYHAREVAIKYSQITGARVILGSATPAIETFYKAKSGHYNLCRLDKRINKANLPEVRIIDMKQELAAGNRSVLSEELQARLKKTISQNKQAIIFMNRRGAATFVMCRDCGLVIECPNCNVSLTYHWHKSSRLLCHHCGYTQDVPHRCPGCQSKKIKFFGAGTQRIESEIKRLLPQARILRMDADTTKRRNDHDRIFRSFAAGKHNILIGTQMIAKGLDLPNVSLVGIISADTSLNFPDFRSQERSFQLLTQVSGRTGRRSQEGFVVLQTYHPKNPAIMAAAKHDYDSFYSREIEERKTLNYPPYSTFVKITCRGKNKQKVQKDTQKLADKLRKNNKTWEIMGPAPALVEKVKNNYSWHVLIKAKTADSLGPLKKLDGCWSIDVSPLDLLS